MSTARGTMIYAPPELVLAYEESADFMVTPAQDVWPLGVMAYEVITGGATFPRHTRASIVFQCAHGTRPYPWERPQFQQQPVRFLNYSLLVLAHLLRS